MTSYSSLQFQQEHKLELDKEFEYHGRKAQWAPGEDGPRVWGDEEERISLRATDPIEGDQQSASIALTSDGRFLAVSANATIKLYAIESLTLTSELCGHARNVQQMIFVDNPAGPERSGSARYTLLSSATGFKRQEGVILAWHIDQEGRLLEDLSRMPFAYQKFADEAVAGISHDLRTHHDLSDAQVHDIREGFVEVLAVADKRNRGEMMPQCRGRFPSFGTESISHNHSRWMHIEYGLTTQGGMRPPDELPQIVVRDVVTRREISRLKGHEDAIMWAGWSIDDKTIATACWDETFKIWNAETGECKHTIGKTGGQNWAGLFHPNGKHVLLSGGQPVKLGVYEVETAQEVGHLSPDSPIKLDSWLRFFRIRPDQDLMILQNGLSLLAWQPLRDISSPSRSRKWRKSSHLSLTRTI